ncbi:SO2930 family diheme c-type cytochrome [Psychrosphaera algicola]|uniref:Repeat protein (TIGR03806 family) n=1 Tax=Psychrosphaera algicola TaxID=3023714 RepID=A0ABT5F8U5_9GAMM|nr:SO2930 family diheme c-type cytochrome [Psychrosphaera sp. G1-22]MDC2887948.1 hypothetical protein [Psychrosphaera sp. G1-22]
MKKSHLIFYIIMCFCLFSCGETSKTTPPEDVVDVPKDDDSTDIVVDENDDKNDDENAVETLEEKLARLALASPADCQQDSTSVNWDALSHADCNLLSQYKLFKNIKQPQYDANGAGQYYQLSAELFSDYASKYRFVFLPENSQMTYSFDDAFEMPLGTVLVKTFAMPFDTAIRGAEHERLIETRLLIKRTDGWVALPFKWTDDGEDAILTKYGALVDVVMTNAQQTIDFRYEIPSKTTCKNCHQKETDTNELVFLPIGLKARFLNWPLANQSETQLRNMQINGLLSGDETNIAATNTVPKFPVTDLELDQAAKGYLDVNCAHCHQDGGFGGISGLRLEYWRDATSIKHGICKKPPGYDGGLNHLSYDIVLRNAEQSILPYRMSVTTAKDIMPPIGRHSVHLEGIKLINDWINRMPIVSCNN